VTRPARTIADLRRVMAPERVADAIDRARDARLMLAGYEVLRFTHRQVREAQERVAAVLRTLLRRGKMPATFE
jgi:very-short-patch-repair endonuclease